MHDGVTISPFFYSIKLITPSNSLNVSAMTILSIPTWFK